MSLGTAEQRFLLRAALELPAGSADSALDWAAVDARARRLGLHGLAWQAAARLGFEPAPEGLASLRRHALHDAAQTALTVNAFVRATRALAGAGLDCMALKGIALVACDASYGPLRHVSDLDLLVRARDVDAVDAALRAAGARPAPHRPTMAGEAGPAAAAREGAAGVGGYLDASGVPIDLHVRPPAELEGGEDGLWARSVRVTAQGAEVRVPSLPDQLAIACEHVLVHHGGEPKLFPRHAADVGRLVRLGALDGPGRRPAAVDTSLRLLEDARRAAEPGAPLALSRMARALSPAWSAAEGGARAAAYRLRARAGVIGDRGWTAIFPSRAYLAASYGVRADAWWLPALHLRRLLLDQPLAILGLGRPPPGDPPPR